MTDRRCAECCMLFPEEELLVREDDGTLVCSECAGLMKEESELLTCAYDE